MRCSELFHRGCHAAERIGLVVGEEDVDGQQVAVLVEQFTGGAGDDGVEQALVTGDLVPGQATLVHSCGGLLT
ncbi:hypothetical protein D3C80_1963400 [compost metagenome]